MIHQTILKMFGLNIPSISVHFEFLKYFNFFYVSNIDSVGKELKVLSKKKKG